MKDDNSRIPTFDRMLLPAIQALQILGGSGTIEEIYEKVIEILKISDKILEIPHGNTSQTEVQYRLAWTRTYLKKYGILENSSRGIWSLASNDINLEDISVKDIVKSVRDGENNKQEKIDISINAIDSLEIEEEETWEQKLHKILLSLEPTAFERLVQFLLRESGFVNVQVTGKSGDGGIDGMGVARINGFLSFHVLFQCKRYQGAITSSQIRDFRGAMQGRTDKGLFITTGTFTRDAVKESTRDGTYPIDLIDGQQLVQRLKELGIGVKINMIESVEIDEDWYRKI